MKNPVGTWIIPEKERTELKRKLPFAGGSLTGKELRQNANISELWNAEDHYAEIYLTFHLTPERDQKDEGLFGYIRLEEARTRLENLYQETGVASGESSARVLTFGLEKAALEWAAQKGESAAISKLETLNVRRQ